MLLLKEIQKTIKTIVDTRKKRRRVEHRRRQRKEIHMRAAVGTEIVAVEFMVVAVVVVVATVLVGNIGLEFKLFKLGFFKIRFAR